MIPDLITAADIAERNGDHDKAARFRAQDRERGLARWNIIGDGRNPDGSWSKEALDFVSLCVAQCRENLAAGSAPRTRRDPAKDANELAPVQRLLGISAKPQAEDER